MDFQEWMKAVDRVVSQRVGLSVHDLADCCFMDWFNDGMTPQDAAYQAIRNDGGGDVLDDDEGEDE